MSIISNSLRPFWFPKLNEINAKPTQRLAGWVSGGEFQVYEPATIDSNGNIEKFNLHIADTLKLRQAFACDCSRMATVAFETINSIKKDNIFPRGTGWLVIKSYYAAFFAAHAILRIFGISCSQLEHGEIQQIIKISDIFGYPLTQLRKGFYCLHFDPQSNNLICQKLSGNTHEDMWIIFHDKLHSISNEILSHKGKTKDLQTASTLLSEICTNLSNEPARRGNWLSYMRNRINYHHDFSTWFPYNGYQDYYDSLFDIIARWKNDPSNFRLWIESSMELRKFSETCMSIVSICRDLVIDMSRRCPNGKSFYTYNALNFLNRV